MQWNAPPLSVEAHGRLYEIEIGLREWLIAALSSLGGPRWWKQRLPADVKERFARAREYERQYNWMHLIEHHPIYYTDFPDLKKVIEFGINWKDFFNERIGKQKTLLAALADLEPIRNKVAHNRHLSSSDIDVVRATHARIRNVIGPEQFVGFLEHPSVGTDLKALFEQLKHVIISSRESMQSYEQFALLHWPQVSESWWWDPEYLGVDVSSISTYFGTVEDYLALPRRRGEGHRLETWVHARNIENMASEALKAISVLAGSS